MTAPKQLVFRFATVSPSQPHFVSKLWKLPSIQCKEFRSVVRLAALVLVTAVTGCGLTVQQRTAVQQFGSATSDFAALTRAEFIQSRQDVIEMNRLRVLLGDDSVESLDAPFTADVMLPRLRALDALSEYGTLLQILLTTSSEAELQGSAAGLISSFRRVPGVAVSDEQKNALGKAVAFGGSGLVEHKRAKSVKEVIELAHPHVTNLIQIVQRDFDPNSDLWNAGYRRTRLDLRRAIRSIPSVESTNLSDLQLVRTAKLAEKEADIRFGLTSTKMMDAVSELCATQDHLYKAIQSGEPVTELKIESYRQKIDDMKVIFELLRQ